MTSVTLTDGGIFVFSENNFMSKHSETGENTDKHIQKIIDNDNHTELKEFTEKNSIVFTRKVFEYCSEKLAYSCFCYLYAQRTKQQCKADIEFRKFAEQKALEGKTIDDKIRWAPQKRQVSNSAPSGYKNSWNYTVPESCFMIALNNVTDNKEKTKSFLKLLQMFRIPIGDVTLNAVNYAGVKIQGYMSMFTKYFETGFKLYPGELKKLAPTISNYDYDP